MLTVTRLAIILCLCISSHLAVAQPLMCGGRLWPVSAHVLDTAFGRPAANMTVRFQKMTKPMPEEVWTDMDGCILNEDGRCNLLRGEVLQVGNYKLVYDTGAYFEAQGVDYFYPRVEVIFRVTAPEEHYHVPILLSPFGWSNDRGVL